MAIQWYLPIDIDFIFVRVVTWVGSFWFFIRLLKPNLPNRFVPHEKHSPDKVTTKLKSLLL